MSRSRCREFTLMEKDITKNNDTISALLNDACVNNDEFELPIKCRYTTDRNCLILILICWIIMNLIGFCSIGIIKSSYLSQGNPELLLHGVDYMGNICSVDGPVRQFAKIWKPNKYDDNPNNQGEYVPTAFSICISSCPLIGQTILDPYEVYGQWTVKYATTEIIDDCLYSYQNQDTTSALTILSDFVRSAASIALFGFFISVLTSAIFISVIRIPMVLRSLIWFCIALVLTILSVGGYFVLSKAKSLEEDQSMAVEDKVEIALLKALGGFLVSCAVIWICCICFMRQRIALAIGLVKESFRALLNMPLLFLLPIVQTIVFAGFSALWMFYCFYLVSSGSIETHTDNTAGISYKTVSYDQHSQQAILFMAFVWLWSFTFSEAMGQLIVSHCVVSWFFSENRNSVGSWKVIHSALLCCRYHMGTAAMGSFIITVFRCIRIVLEYIKSKMQKRGTALSRCILTCLSCALFCFEKFIKFLNKHAYVQCAIFGRPFMPSAAMAFCLIAQNLGRLAAVTMVGDFVVLVGKLSISLTCGALAYYYFATYQSNELSEVVLPTVFVAFLAFATSTLFLGMLSASTDAMLQACIAEEEMKKRSIHCCTHDDQDKTLRELISSHKQSDEVDDLDEEIELELPTRNASAPDHYDTESQNNSVTSERTPTPSMTPRNLRYHSLHESSARRPYAAIEGEARKDGREPVEESESKENTHYTPIMTSRIATEHHHRPSPLQNTANMDSSGGVQKSGGPLNSDRYGRYHRPDSVESNSIVATKHRKGPPLVFE